MGGNCRLRSYVPLKGKGLKEVRGQNPNPFFRTPVTPEPLIHTETSAQPSGLRKVYEYDLSTRKGDIIEISRQ
jgi:alpha-L-fucosidase 2